MRMARYTKPKKLLKQPSTIIKEAKHPIYREDDDELLGYVTQDETSWLAQTFFEYTITRTETREAAEAILHNTGLSYLLGTWQYFDKEERDWFPCIIKEAHKNKVTVIRTNAMGYQDPDDYKLVTIQHPDENSLIKNS